MEVVVWSGWVGGIGIGLYMLTQYLLTGKALGVSTGYGNLCAIGSKRPFFSTDKYKEPFNWRLLFLLGIPLGGVVAVLTSPDATLNFSFSLGEMYDGVMPSALWARGLILVLGGVLMGVGARMAGGCTSGHAISGLALGNGPSLIAAMGFFVGGIAAVQILFAVAG